MTALESEIELEATEIVVETLEATEFESMVVLTVVLFAAQGESRRRALCRLSLKTSKKKSKMEMNQKRI